MAWREAVDVSSCMTKERGAWRRAIDTLSIGLDEGGEGGGGRQFE